MSWLSPGPRQPQSQLNVGVKRHLVMSRKIILVQVILFLTPIVMAFAAGTLLLGSCLIDSRPSRCPEDPRFYILFWLLGMIGLAAMIQLIRASLFSDNIGPLGLVVIFGIACGCAVCLLLGVSLLHWGWTGVLLSAIFFAPIFLALTLLVMRKRLARSAA